MFWGNGMMECWIIGFGGLTIKLIGMNLIEIKFRSAGAYNSHSSIIPPFHYSMVCRMRNTTF
jgi:hypothetical protein